MSKSEHYGYVAKQYYNFILGCLLISLIIVSIMFISILRNYQRDDWQNHRRMIYSYLFFMLFSLAIKFSLVHQLTDYNSDTNLIKFTISEMLALTLFSVFKLDEDCFTCFNRCQEIPNYSIFQMGDKKQGFILIESEEPDQMYSKNLIE